MENCCCYLQKPGKFTSPDMGLTVEYFWAEEKTNGEIAWQENGEAGSKLPCAAARWPLLTAVHNSAAWCSVVCCRG
jgi:hypothetical protein